MARSVLWAAAMASTARAFVSPVPRVPRLSRQHAHWMDHLKFGGSAPAFDVVAKTQEYLALKDYAIMAPYYADDYVFRGSIIGPITASDVYATQQGFNVQGGYPDLDRGIFGLTVDPANPYRVLFFERWTATHTGELKIGKWITLPATRNKVETPIHVTSLTWNPAGKLIYQCISPPVDRFEGNTKGAGAILGLLAGAGVDSGPTSVGLPSLMLQQKVFQFLGFAGRQWSIDADIPKWWKSSARGADPNDI